MTDGPDAPDAPEVPMFNGVPIGADPEPSADSTDEIVDQVIEENTELLDELARSETEESTPDTYKVTVNGEEKEVTLDELTKNYQLQQASHEKFREASEYVKKMNTRLQQVEDIFKYAKEKPMDFLQNYLKIDPVQHAEDLLIQKLEYESLSPEQKELQRLKHQEQQWMEHQKRQQQDAEQAQKEALQKEAAEKVDVEISEALTELGYGTDKKPPAYMVSRVAEELLAALNRGQTLTAKQAADRVKQDYEKSLTELVESLDPKDLPPGMLEKIRKYEVSQAKKKAKVRPEYVPNRKQEQKQEDVVNEPLTGDRKWDDHFRKLTRSD